MKRLSRLLDVLLPLLVFPSLAIAAAYFIICQTLVQNGLQLKLSAICDPDQPTHPLRLPYTNVANADRLLCGMVAFYHALIDPVHNPVLATLFPALAVVSLVPFLEASRDQRPFALRMPTAIGVLFQLAFMGVIMPLYALLLVATDAVSARSSVNSTMRINQGNAEALLFGLVLGYVLPTALMTSLVRPSVTAAWQGFPLLFAVAAFVHKLIRPPSRHIESGHVTVVVTLVLTFLASALLHAVYVWPVLRDAAALRTMFVPVLDAFDPTATSLADGTLECIKWDMIFGLGSVMLATFWMADGLFSLAGMLVWYGIANVALGPAAAITGVFLWRERRLNGHSRAEGSQQKME